MKLQKQLSRRFKGKDYAKWVLTISPDDIEKLKWKEGQELNSEINADTLTIKKAIEITYDIFKVKLIELLNTRELGFTWQEIKKTLNIQQAVPNNLWVSRLESEISLRRKKEGNTTYWYLEKKGITVFTIGYEGKKPEEFIDILKKNSVQGLVDVRELPLSRKNGFSKSVLDELLEKSNIVYRHYQELGSPRELRHKLWTEGNYPEFFKEYSEWLSSPKAKTYLTDLEGLAHVRTTAILCFEKDVEKCHRSIIKKRLIQDGFKVVDL